MRTRTGRSVSAGRWFIEGLFDVDNDERLCSFNRRTRLFAERSSPIKIRYRENRNRSCRSLSRSDNRPYSLMGVSRSLLERIRVGQERVRMSTYRSINGGEEETSFDPLWSFNCFLCCDKTPFTVYSRETGLKFADFERCKKKNNRKVVTSYCVRDISRKKLLATTMKFLGWYSLSDLKTSNVIT